MSICMAGTESEIESAVVAAVQQQANALSIASDAYLNTRSRQIASFALRHALPTICDSRETVAASLLMSYGPNQADTFRQVGLDEPRPTHGYRTVESRKPPQRRPTTHRNRSCPVGARSIRRHD
jgi:putative tryptophan/tyrosine transport system substrate-binding protein